MTHGGARPGAGRKASAPDTVQVNWRVTAKAKEWMKSRAVESGSSIAAVLDDLISFYNSPDDATRGICI